MNQAQQDFFAFSHFNNHKQMAELHPDDPTMYRTFFLAMDHVAKKPKILGLTNWVTGEVPTHIKVAHPLLLQKVRSGNYYSYI